MKKTNCLGEYRKKMLPLCLKIDSSSPSGLRWIWHPHPTSRTRYVGSSWGCEANGYYNGCFLGQHARAHNLIWFLLFEEDPGEAWPLTVDHVDRNGLNNYWMNLRLATASQQVFNRDLSETYTPGAIVHKRKPGKTGFRWVRANRNRFTAEFSVNGKSFRFGTYDTPEEAYQAALHGRVSMGLEVPRTTTTFTQEA